MLDAIRKTWIHEEPGFFILDKPPGIGMHDESDELGLVSLLRQHLNVTDIFPCHRLDKATSGLLVLGKGSTNTRLLSELFSRREIQKYYLAVSGAKPKKKQGSVVGDMAPARGGSWKLCKTMQNPAQTQFFSFGLNGLRGFMVKPATGKTHQIRVALKSLSAPVLGDQRYGGMQPGMTEKFKQFCLAEPAESNPSDSILNSLTNIDRMYLHAYGVHFSLQGKEYVFTRAPAQGVVFQSAEFHQMLAKIGEPHALAWPDIRRYLS